MFYSKNASMAIKNISLEQGCSYIYKGDRGLGKCSAAKQIIMEQCQCSNKGLYCHPDVLIIEPDSGSIKVDQVRQISEFMTYLPSNGKLKYVLIDDANMMTLATQNALLKSLEESRHTVFFLISHEDVLLDTIVSRSKSILFEALTKEQVKDCLSHNVAEIDDFVLDLCSGHIGLYYLYMDKSYKSFRNECEAIINGIVQMKSRRELYELFHCVKEKDKELFLDKYDIQEIRIVLEYLKRGFYNALLSKTQQKSVIDSLSSKLALLYDGPELIKIVSRITRDLKVMQMKGAYNKNDFFDLVRYLNITE